MKKTLFDKRALTARAELWLAAEELYLAGVAAAEDEDDKSAAEYDRVLDVYNEAASKYFAALDSQQN